MRSIRLALIVAFFAAISQISYSAGEVSSNPVVSQFGDLVFVQLTPPLVTQTRVFIFNKNEILCIQDAFDSKEKGNQILFTFKASSNGGQAYTKSLDVISVKDREILMMKLVEILKDNQNQS